MIPAAMIEGAQRDGVSFTLALPDTIKLAGDRLALKRWLPLIRENKPAILAALLEQAAAKSSGGGADDTLTGSLAIDGELLRPAGLSHYQVAEPPAYEDGRRLHRIDIAFNDERRTCTQCRNLMTSGLCAAAARGELNAIRTFEPLQDLLQRCAGFLPEPDDPDQRTGRERRWPA